MTVTILRWKGGYGGDTLLNLIMRSNPGAQCNVVFSSFTDTGAQNIDYSQIIREQLTNVEKLAHVFPGVVVNLDQVYQEVDQIIDSKEQWFIKSHNYNTPKYNHITVDLVADAVSLPFIVAANISKTETLNFNYNKVSHIIKDPEIAKKHAMYNVAVDSLVKEEFSTRTIPVSQVLIDWTTLKEKFAKQDIILDDSVKNIYETWLTLNQQYLPSKEYIQAVNEFNYDYSNTKMSLPERYSLMALGGTKFKIL